MTAKARPRSLLMSATLLLAGCGGLLGGGDHPAALYRFGNTSALAAARDGTMAGRIRLVSFRGATFPVESRGDRILTTHGSNMAYVAESRWIAPATDLFNTALRREFARSLPDVRLIGAAEGPRADFALSIDVRRFEAAYEGGEVPVIVMEATVKLMRWADRAIIGEWTFSSRRPAAENRVASIVSAYDEAAMEIIGDVGRTMHQSTGNAPIPNS